MNSLESKKEITIWTGEKGAKEFESLNETKK